MVNRYLIELSSSEISGNLSAEVIADSKEQALELYHSGEFNISDESFEVQRYNTVSINDVYEDAIDYEEPKPINTLDDMLVEVKKIYPQSVINGSRLIVSMDGMCLFWIERPDKSFWCLKDTHGHEDPQKVLNVLRAIKECE